VAESAATDKTPKQVGRSYHDASLRPPFAASALRGGEDPTHVLRCRANGEVAGGPVFYSLWSRRTLNQKTMGWAFTRQRCHTPRLEMTDQYTDFIGIYPNCISKEACDSIIKDADRHFEAPSPQIVARGAAQMPMLEFGRLDFTLNGSLHLPKSAKIVDDALQQCIERYASTYFVAKQIRCSSKEVKIQKTPPRGGYHFWHCEQFNKETGTRVLAWMIYLNDIPAGEGETEFIWQKLRVQPEAGKCLIWPTQFTHTHRGNPVYSTTKYIATGWYTSDW
jgi:hypothetical protein